MKRILYAVLLALLLPGCNDDDKPAAPAAPAPAVQPAPAVAPAPPAPPPPSANQAPTLVVRFRPTQPGGPVPHSLHVNMCQSTDPDGDRLIFEFKFGGTGGAHFSFHCRDDHTYTRAGTYRAWFCVNDNNDHRVCQNELVGITSP